MRLLNNLSSLPRKQLKEYIKFPGKRKKSEIKGYDSLHPVTEPAYSNPKTDELGKSYVLIVVYLIAPTYSDYKLPIMKGRIPKVLYS